MPYLRVKNELPLIPGYASGDIVRFSDAAVAPLNVCTCYINPVQDLHGQDYPYPSGGGKNKLALTVDNIKTNNGGASSWSGNSKTINDVTFTIQTNDVGAVVGIKVTGTASSTTTLYLGTTDLVSGTSYTINGCPSNGSSTTFSLMLMVGGVGSSALANDFGAGVSYTETSSQSRGLQIVVRSGYAIPTGGFVFYPMIRLSSVTDPTFAPYSNICPITGHTELNLVQKDGNDTVVHTYTNDLGTTVYGGTLDVETGVLTIDRGMMKLSDINWTDTTSNPPIFRGRLSSIPNIQLPPNNSVPTTAITESFGAYAYSPLSSSTIGKFAVSDGGSNRIVFIDNSVNTLEAFLQKYGDDILVYPLATPTTTQLTPQEVKSLLGSNNIYHDCNGDTKVIYIRRNDS